MSQVQRLGEIDLLKPGYFGLHPTKARELAVGLRKFAEKVGGVTRVESDLTPGDTNIRRGR